MNWKNSAGSITDQMRFDRFDFVDAGQHQGFVAPTAKCDNTGASTRSPGALHGGGLI